MIVIVQRVRQASVSIEDEIYASIGTGMLVLLGIDVEDTLLDADYICTKLIGLRIFSDLQGKMNLALTEVGGEILLISQFTLLANTAKGNRPSYIAAARPEQAIPLYEYVINQLNKSLGHEIKTGVFGADMKVGLTNDGPVTIIINSKDKK